MVTQPDSPLTRIRKQPWLLAYGLRGLLNGYRAKLWHGLIRRRLRAGRHLRVYGKVHFQGPGRIVCGDNVHLLGDVLKPACFLTTSPDATITLGDHTGVNGTTFSARRRITVGQGCAIAAHYITDNQNHPIAGYPITDAQAPIEAAPVTIGDHVYLAAMVVVAHGVSIGDHAVVGAGSIVRHDVPARTMAAGNPVKVIRAIEPSNAPPSREGEQKHE